MGKTSMVKSDECETCLINRPFKSTSRFYKNDLAKQVLAIEKAKGDQIKYEDVQALTSGQRRSLAWKTGDVDACMVSAGQGIGLIHEIATVQEVLSSIVNEAQETIRVRLSRMAKL